MKSKKNRRSSMTFGEKMIFFAGVLFCLVLITTAMMGGLFARYTTIGSGSDSARVASWGQLTLTESGDFGENGSVTPKVIPGVNLDKNVKVSFTGSEMATYVFVSLDLSNHWTSKNNLDFSAAGGKINWRVNTAEWTYLPGSSYVYYKILQPNTSFTDVPVLVEKDENGHEITVDPTLTGDYVNTMTGCKIYIQASVIQAGNMSLAEAWTYLNS